MSIHKRFKSTTERAATRGLFAGLLSLLGLGLLFPLVIAKVGQVFPGMTFAGWLILGVMFVVTVAVCTPISVWIEKRWHWSEDRAQYLPVIIAVLFWIALIGLNQDSLATWFGKATLPFAQ